jgi:hypothetical protein
MISLESITCGQCNNYSPETNTCKIKEQTEVEHTTEKTPVIIARIQALNTSRPLPIMDILRLITCFKNPGVGTQLVARINEIYVNRPEENILTLPVASPGSA